MKETIENNKKLFSLLMDFTKKNLRKFQFILDSPKSIL